MIQHTTNWICRGCETDN